MGIKYKGFEIYKTFRFGYSYYKISGEKQLYSRLTDAKLAIDHRTAENA